MNKLKNEKGITLVALIITIIVLLILAVVTISAVTGDGILGHAKNAQVNYVAGQNTENETIGNYVSYLDDKVGLVGSSGIPGGNSGSNGENTSESKLGKYVRYDVNKNGVIENNQYESILWRVLRDDGDKVELITADALGKVTLRSDGFDNARSDYNRAVELMVQECIRVTGISSVRNVGGPATEEALSATNTIDFSELKEFSPIIADSEFTKYEGTTNGLRKGDENNNYLTDYNQMEKAGIRFSDNSEEYYWLASRYVIENSGSVYFGVRCVASYGLGIGDLCSLMDNGNVDWWSVDYPHPVRPVLTLEFGVLDNAKGAGTKAEPIEIY